jgi:hypothetical protein
MHLLNSPAAFLTLGWTLLAMNRSDLHAQGFKLPTPQFFGENETGNYFESTLKLILNHQESRCTEKLNITPKHRSSNYESIQTIIFIQPGISLHPFSC